MNSIRNFILDNLRYILSGILLILIVIILVQCTDTEEKPKDTGDNVVAAADEQPAAEEEPVEEPNDLVQDAYSEVNSLIQAYFDARAAGDVDALRLTVNELGDTEANSVTNMSQYIESYDNITCYTKLGPAENSYVVYVCYDIKFQNIDTLAPSLNMLYVCTSTDGSLYIDNSEWDEQTEAAIVELNSAADVQALVTQVEDAYNAALAQDEKLSSLNERIQATAAGSEGGAGDETAAEGTETEGTEETPTQEGETVYALDTVNVRSQADENAERIGQIARGDSATRISEDGNGWSQITYNNATAYVKSEYLTTNRDEIGAGGTVTSGSARIVETARVRAGEDTSSELLDTLYEGTQVEVVEVYASGRAQIKYDNGSKTGYVNAECVGN